MTAFLREPDPFTPVIGKTVRVSGHTTERASVRSVFGNREFRALLSSALLSVLGDQIARIAVAVLVFRETDSAFASSATVACTFLTWMVGGPFLSALADRLPRRSLMVWCDLLRAALVAVLVIPGLPLWALFVVILAVGVLTPPFDSARGSVLPEVLDGDAYQVGNGLMGSVQQTAMLLGFLVGGVLVAALSPQGALAVDAVTFVGSAALIQLAVRPHRQKERAASSLPKDAIDGVHMVARDRRLRRPLTFGVLGAAVMIAPEGMAVPVANDLGGGPVLAGILIAALPCGYVVGSLLLVQIPGEPRAKLLCPLIAVSCLPMLASSFVDQAWLLVVLWGLSGCAAAASLIANAQYMTAAPDGTRGRAFGVAALALNGAAGLVLVLVGGLTEAVAPLTAVSLVAAATLVLLLPMIATEGYTLPTAPLRPPPATGRDWFASRATPSPQRQLGADRGEPGVPLPRRDLDGPHTPLAVSQGRSRPGRSSAG
jgi:MFS family permease